jgi:hypothetical protein
MAAGGRTDVGGGKGSGVSTGFATRLRAEARHGGERTDYAVHLAPVQNRLLASMSAETFNHLRPHLERVPLRRREILQERNRPLEHVHFIERGVASLFARTSRDGPVEVAMIGRLGLVGIPVVLGTMRSPNRCLVQARLFASRRRTCDGRSMHARNCISS